jgi:hypothetical protein
VFETAASEFNKGITVQSMGGVVLSESVTTKSTELLINGGTGSLTIVATKVLSSTNQMLTLTVDDFDFQGHGSLTTGSALLSVTCTTGATTMGIGRISRELTLSGSELAFIAANGTLIGGSTFGVATVSGIEQSHSMQIDETLTLLLNRDDAQVTFAEVSSTFNTLAVQADDGISIVASLATVVGDLWLDGDYDDSSSNDSRNDIQTGHQVTVTANKQLVLEASSGGVHIHGDSTLRARAGIWLHEHLHGDRGSIVINADYAGDQVGIFTVASNKVLDHRVGNITITAWDLDIRGSLSSGGWNTVLHGSGTNHTIGLGEVNDLQITDSELSRMTMRGGLTIGSSTTSSMVVDGVTEISSSTFGIVALETSGAVEFNTTSSNFNQGIIVQASSGVKLNVNVSTTNNATAINAGAAAMSLAPQTVLNTHDQFLQLTCTDLEIGQDALISTGMAGISIHSTAMFSTIGLGDNTNADMRIENSW